MAYARDVNRDGLFDLVLYFATKELQLSDEDTEAVLEGDTYGGQRIRGTDSVSIVHKIMPPGFRCLTKGEKLPRRYGKMRAD